MFEYPVAIATTLPCEIPPVPPALVNANDDVVAKDALTACKTYDAVVANVTDPERDPVIPCVTVSEPLTVELF